MNRQTKSFLLSVPILMLCTAQGIAQSAEKKPEAAPSLSAPVQVEVEVKFVAFTKSLVDGLMQKESGGCVSVEALQGLIKDGKAQILFAPRLITKSGANAEVKAVTECIYPSRFEAATYPGVEASATNAPPRLEKSTLVPADFQTRDTGVILSVTPVVGPEGHSIDLTLMPQTVAEPVWKDYSTTMVDASGRPQQVKMEQPFFSTRSLATSVTIDNGSTVLLGGGMNIKGDDKEVVYVFVTARTVNSQGKPMQK